MKSNQQVVFHSETQQHVVTSSLCSLSPSRNNRYSVWVTLYQKKKKRFQIHFAKINKYNCAAKPYLQWLKCDFFLGYIIHSTSHAEKFQKHSEYFLFVFTTQGSNSFSLMKFQNFSMNFNDVAWNVRELTAI